MSIRTTLAALAGAATLLVLGACHGADVTASPEAPRYSTDGFGVTRGGEVVREYTLRNARGTTARLIDFGATLRELWVRDRDGKRGDVVLGFDALEPYETVSPYFGCTTGRVANRIAFGKFALDGREYQLATNNGEHHLHGGEVGLGRVVWKGAPFADDRKVGVRFTYESPDGEDGYPGNLSLAVTYTLTHQDVLRIEYSATTDQATPVNLTHHSYFNLGTPAHGDILGHLLELHASRYTASDASMIPTGSIDIVHGTPLDFTVPKPIGQDIAAVPGGYDLNYVVQDAPSQALVAVARVEEPDSGRVMEIYSTEPGVQFYTGNFLDGSLTGKGGTVYQKHGGFCLETQHFPDAVNHREFPSVILRPGETYRHVIEHRFSAP